MLYELGCLFIEQIFYVFIRLLCAEDGRTFLNNIYYQFTISFIRIFKQKLIVQQLINSLQQLNSHPTLFNDYDSIQSWLVNFLIIINKLIKRANKFLHLFFTFDTMFRNIYIEAYKNSIQQNSSLEVMLIHVNHMYAGMGCILQDIQFMVGNVLNHIKSSGNNSSKGFNKNEVKERISMPQKLEQVTFKMPKYQFLPSSSAKYQNFDLYKPKFNEPQQVRSHNLQQSISKRNDSFEEMFPARCKTKATQNEDKSNTRNQKANSNPVSNQRKQEPPQQSQEDFMDYLFNKKNRN